MPWAAPVELIRVATTELIGPALADLPTLAERELAFGIVREYGHDTLSFFKLRQDKYYFFDDAQTAFVGYRVEARTLLVSGDPVGPPETIPELLEQLREFAHGHGLKLAALGATPGIEAIYRKMGLYSLYVGDEAVVETQRFTLEGRKIRKVRQSVHRLERAGYSTEIVRPSDVDPRDLSQIDRVIEIGRFGRDEIGFAMGMDTIHGELAQHTLIALAKDADGIVRGVLHFVPCYGREALSLSMMRRDPDSPNGLMEYLLATSFISLRERGILEVSLNFAGMTKALRNPEGLYEHVLQVVSKAASRVLPLEGLYEFNRKFSPRWDPRYLVYEGRFGLPRAAVAGIWAEGQMRKPSWLR